MRLLSRSTSPAWCDGSCRGLVEASALADAPGVRVVLPVDPNRGRPGGIKFACVRPLLCGMDKTVNPRDPPPRYLSCSVMTRDGAPRTMSPQGIPGVARAVCK